jgi:dihydrofolate synthase/folylpolyglutamate synthase
VSDAWSEERAERHLRSLELFGMRFGLDRMRRMMTVMGSPEREFRSIHVLGTNGKTSTTRMTAAILERHGVRTGSYTSPHLVSYGERVQVGEQAVPMGAFAAAVARAAWAAERVNRTLAENDHVTQFELLTAAAFWELARRDVEVAVVEAGLGGRYDATSVITSEVTVLTNVGLEHTRWLGPTVADIAEEKLAVVSPGSTLALGCGLHEDALAVAHRVATEQGAKIVQVGIGEEWSRPLLAAGAFQRANFALARVAAESYLKAAGIEPRAEAVNDAALHTATPGRMQVVSEEPLTVFDGAHNPDAVAALVESLPELLQGREVGLVLGVLEDKDAATMLHTLLALCERAWFTAPPSPRALSPAALQSLARQQGFEEVVCEPQPRKALALAQGWAREQPQARTVLATGSIYLVGDLLGEMAETGSAEAESGAAWSGEPRAGEVRAGEARPDDAWSGEAPTARERRAGS